MKAHFIGICGIGMSAVAKLLRDKGYEISGSDVGFYPPVSDYLTAQNIPFTEGYRAENIPKKADVIIISRNAKLNPEENEEVRAACESGIPIKSFSEVLGELAAETENIVVAGSYGKSTVTGILAWCLLHAGRNPSYFLGAVPRNDMPTSELGTGNTFVLEGDEYPTSHTDSRSKFLHFNPHDVLLTSAEHDHVNVFPTLEKYLEPFRQLLALVPADGIILACTDGPNVSELIAKYSNAVTYGLDPEATWSAANIQYGETTTFSLTKDREVIAHLSTTLLGKHNVENIVGAGAMLLEKNLLTPEELTDSVRTFEGIKRRLDLLSPRSSVRVYEGFGSSYEKANAALDALKLHFPDRRLIVVFEPHTFSWRNRDTIHWYDDIFAESSTVYVYHPAEQGAGTHQQLSQEEIVERITKSGIKAVAIKDAEDALGQLEKKLQPDDVILLLTSGDLGGLITEIPKLVKKKFPK